jgi:N-acetylmuramoyl-L-alanine amidase
MSNLIFAIDNGHGGVINGEPQTAGKRSKDFGKGILYEGVTNRAIAKKVLEMCKKAGISAINLVPEAIDISLGERVRRVNKLDPKTTILISIHSNASDNESASGFEIFTTVGQNGSDIVAETIFQEFKTAFPKANFRTDTGDGDNDKEVDFFVIKKANCRAVLIENWFMTNKDDYELLMSEKGQNDTAKAIFEGIKKLNK